jgi:hypothetical protein
LPFKEPESSELAANHSENSFREELSLRRANVISTRHTKPHISHWFNYGLEASYVKTNLNIAVLVLFAIMVLSGFAQPSFAVSDTLYSWSSNNTAWAYVAGAYLQVGDTYNPQAHEGNITEGNVVFLAHTRFTQFDDENNLIFDSYQLYLCNNTGKKEMYSHEGVYFIRTWTNSYYDNSSSSVVTVEIGPSGMQR